MTTLVLGHGRKYTREETKCSPIDVDLWVHMPHTTVDVDPTVLPDVVADMHDIPWAFAEEASYDRIIDATGSLLSRRLYEDPRFITELRRVLRTRGVFFGAYGFRFVNV